jgi:hypothetical protein
MANYEVIENEKGYLLYKNVTSSETSTDSPYLIAKIRDLKAQFLGINYVTYRCGLKLFALKKELFSKLQPFFIFTRTLQLFRVSSNRSSIQFCGHDFSTARIPPTRRLSSDQAISADCVDP